jgi:ligand-binding sensor domain-containing protein
MKLRLFFFCLVITLSGYSQTGNYLLSNFSPDEEHFNLTCFDIIQDERGVFYFATQAGVLQFDGRNWDNISSTGTLYAISHSQEGVVYVAGSLGFGKIIKNDLGMEEYESLYNVKGTESVFQIVTLTDHAYFLSDQLIFEYSVTSGSIREQKATSETGTFLALHEIFGKAYVSAEKGLFEIAKGEAVSANFGTTDSVSFIFAHRFNDQYLIGTDDNKLYLLKDNQPLQEIILQDETYTNAGVIINAAWVNEKLIAVGTLRGGVIFINPTTGATEEIINYNTGLPDNEVFALICDKNQNVWAAHNYGFTRISPYLPFRSFRYYPGLQGNLLCATTYNGFVYVGTSQGLYKLQQQEFYDEISYFVEVPVTVKTKTKTVAKKKEQQVAEQEHEERESKGLFGFLKKKRKEVKSVSVDRKTTEEEPENSTEEVKQQFKREKRTKKIMRDSYFAYSPVPGVDSKITQLIPWKGKLIAVGLDGAFEIGETITRIIQEPIRFLFASEKLDKLIVSTYNGKLIQYEFDTKWIGTESIRNINEPINYIFEEDTTAIWFCGFDKVFRINNHDQKVRALTIAKNNFDELLGISLNKQVFIAASSGFYFYDRVKEELVEGDTIHKPTAYFASSSNLWFRDQHNWFTAGKSGGHNNLQLLNLFRSIRFIDSDPHQGSLWIITGNNELLQFNSEAIRKEEILYPLILKSIENNSVLLPRRETVKIDQDKSSIKVEVIRPDFIGARFIEYRYKLQGLNPQWSEWSVNNNVIDFPFLPTGEYTMLIQSKDIFGRINELKPLKIEVEPPYWKETWFYAAEFSVFLFLVILSFRLSYRFIFISRVLSLLAIIIFIEFIQTIAGSTFSTHSSPVFDFAIQVGVAFIVLPVEGFLRRYFLQAITKRNQVNLKAEIGTDEEEIRKAIKPRKTKSVPEQP